MTLNNFTEFTFNSKEDEEENLILKKLDKEIFTFYQICEIKNPISKMYSVRKFKFNKNGKLLEFYDCFYDKKRINRFLKTANINKYRLYPYSDCSYFPNPSDNDLFQAQSDLLNNKNEFY